MFSLFSSAVDTCSGPHRMFGFGLPESRKVAFSVLTAKNCLNREVLITNFFPTSRTTACSSLTRFIPATRIDLFCCHEQDFPVSSSTTIMLTATLYIGKRYCWHLPLVFPVLFAINAVPHSISMGESFYAKHCFRQNTCCVFIVCSIKPRIASSPMVLDALTI